MKKGILSSVVLAGLGISGAQAMDFNFFGHVGGFYDQGFGAGNKTGIYNDGFASDKKVGYAGVTGHLGIDLGFNALHIGVGAYSGVPIWGTDITNYGSYANAEYSKKYVDLSDLYLKYDAGDMTIAVGRFNNEFLGSDWITSYTQGVAAKWKVRNFGIWATWINDSTTYGYQPGRIASELSSWKRFPSSFDSFGIGNETFAGGMNFDFGFLKIDPFVHYYLHSKTNDTIQAGAKLALVFGENGPVQSTTAFRYLWQNTFSVDNDSTMLFWGDEELLFGGFFKLGGGYYATTGGNGISTLNNVTRFYGSFFTPNYYGQQLNYFTANKNVWYVFTGVKSQWFDLDVLYADGNYSEFSAVASVTLFDTQVKGSLNGIALKLGGGYVSNGFNKAHQLHNVVAFAKLSF